MLERLAAALLCGAVLVSAACEERPAGPGPAAEPAAPKAGPAAEPGHAKPDDHPAAAARPAPAGPLDVELGEPLQGAARVSVEALLDDPAAWEGKRVRVEGEVRDMCFHRRGWFGVASADGQKVIRVMTAPRFQVPAGAIGARAEAEGKVKVITLPASEIAHYKKVHKFVSEKELASEGPIRQAVIVAAGAEFSRPAAPSAEQER
ncbi:MAG: hypothetical protein JXR96_01945 [Deltaproteobacteria bacterium]|nr:hypothetical protein [Deltaproteobacteria bacterium]